MSRSAPKSKQGEKLTAGGVSLSGGQYDLSRPDFTLPFFHYLTVPPNTSILDPLVYVMPLPIGMIRRLWVEFPKGCMGLVGLQIHRSTRQIFPLPDGVWMRSNNAVFDFQFTHAINSEPYEVTLKAYSIDDTYFHTVWVGLEVSGFESELTPQMKSFIKTITG